MSCHSLTILAFGTNNSSMNEIIITPHLVAQSVIVVLNINRIWIFCYCCNVYFYLSQSLLNVVSQFNLICCNR